MKLKLPYKTNWLIACLFFLLPLAFSCRIYSFRDVSIDYNKIKTIKIQIKKDIDTLILKDNHLFRVQTSGDFLNIDVECRQPEKIITRVDTIKIYQRELVEIPTVEYRLGNSEVFFIGYGLGTAVTIAVVYLVTKLR